MDKSDYIRHIFNRKINTCYKPYCKRFGLEPSYDEKTFKENCLILYKKFASGEIVDLQEYEEEWRRTVKKGLRDREMIKQWLTIFLKDKKPRYNHKEIDESLKHYFENTETPDGTYIYYGELKHYYSVIIKKVAKDFGYYLYRDKIKPYDIIEENGKRFPKKIARYELTSHLQEEDKEAKEQLKNIKKDIKTEDDDRDINEELFYKPKNKNIREWLDYILKDVENEFVITTKDRKKSFKDFFKKDTNISSYDLLNIVEEEANKLGWKFKNTAAKNKNRKSIRVWKFKR